MDVVCDEIISKILVELDTEHAEYQRLHRKIYGKNDHNAEYIHKKMVNLCKRIREEIVLHGKE